MVGPGLAALEHFQIFEIGVAAAHVGGLCGVNRRLDRLVEFVLFHQHCLGLVAGRELDLVQCGQIGGVRDRYIHLSSTQEDG